MVGGAPQLTLVGAAANADEAIAIATEHRPDVALLDVRMPGGGGVRAARELRLCSPETKVVALSASGERSSVLDMLEAGSVGYLVKGGPIQTILQTIVRAADGQSSLSAEVTGDVIEELVEQLAARRRSEERLQAWRRRIEGAIRRPDALDVVGQPICALESLDTVGMEALARFPGRPHRGPEQWFAEASEVGLRTELELVAARRALARLDELPPDAFLSVNLSPATVATAGFRRLVAKAPPGRVVIEITEHAPIEDYDELNAALAGAREHGLRLAIDDAGAGFASLRHILRLAPDFIKLDNTLVGDVEHDRSQQALATGLISFAETIGATIIAEGIENAAALRALRRLGVRFGQGYYLGRPTHELAVAKGRLAAV